MLPLSTIQRHDSHHSLNVHDIYRENIKTNITLHVAGGCEKHWSRRWYWLVLSWREKSRRGVRRETVVVGP